MAAEPTINTKEMTAQDFFGDDADETTPAQLQPPDDPGETEEVPASPTEAPPEAPVAEPPVPETPVAEPPPAEAPAETPAEAAPEAPVQIPGYPPGVKPPPWKDFEKYKQDSERLAQMEALRQAEQAELIRLRTIQQMQEQQRQAALQQPQGPWTPESNRVPTQQEYNLFYEQDPITATNWLAMYNAQQNAVLQQQYREQQEQMAITEQGNVFRRQNPDYDTALNYIRDYEIRTAEAMGLKTDEQKQRYLEQRIREATQIAQATGRSIHEVIYDYGKSVGWATQTEAPTEPAATPPPTPTTSPVDKIRAANARAAATATAIGPTGATMIPATLPTKAEVDAASPEQLDEWDRVHGEDWMDRAVKSW